MLTSQPRPERTVSYPMDAMHRRVKMTSLVCLQSRFAEKFDARDLTSDLCGEMTCTCLVHFVCCLRGKSPSCFRPSCLLFTEGRIV